MSSVVSIPSGYCPPLANTLSGTGSVGFIAGVGVTTDRSVGCSWFSGPARCSPPCSLSSGLWIPLVAPGSDAASRCGEAICVLVTLDSYRLALWSGGWLLLQ